MFCINSQILRGLACASMISVCSIFAQDAPPAGDGGTEAVAQSQVMQMPNAQKKQNAQSILKQLMKKQGWEEGWDVKKGRIIVLETAEFNCSNPSQEENLFVQREMAAKRAVLQAKASIIETIKSEMSASEKLDMPGTDVNKALGAEREALKARMEAQREVLAELMDNVDKAEAAMLRGTTFGDRLNDLLAAAIKKLEKEYNKSERDEKAKAAYEAAKAQLIEAQQQYKDLLAKAEKLDEDVKARQESKVAILASMPLYGATVLMQTESWMKNKYQVAVAVCWSKSLERAVRAIVTGEEYKVPTSKDMTVHQWLDSQNMSCMVGPRQFLDKDGNRWFLGIAARPYSEELSSLARRKNKGLAEMFARQMAAFCLYADVETWKLAQQAMETHGDDRNDISATAESYAEKMSQQFANKTVRGMQKLWSGEVPHPITGENILVVAYGISPEHVAASLEAERINYATKIMDNQHQTVERGRSAANQAAVKASENRQEDFNAGYGEQAKNIDQTLQDRQQQAEKGGVKIIHKDTRTQPPAKHAPQQGVFGGDANVSDDF